MRAHFQYLKYLLRHKYWVFIECCRLDIFWLGISHDWSKFRPSEWKPYVLSFYGGYSYKERPQWLIDRFDLAWLHHQRRNKHHFQYYILIQDAEGDKVLPMPDKYRREMLADWRGTSRAIHGADNTREWYLKRRKRMKDQLHPETRMWVENQLNIPRDSDSNSSSESTTQG